ncbi:hypothetical protein [Solibacillus cecembensis]|uniref:hypothetical protein n=1 Tax=Solibacillus cecembensis TaxID=459347 RepID=UPI003D07F782
MNLNELASKQLLDFEIDIETDDLFDFKVTIENTKKDIEQLKSESNNNALPFIKTLEFDNNKWIFSNLITGNSEVIDFTPIEKAFTFIKHTNVNDLVNALKCWVIHRLVHDELSPTSVETYFNYLVEALIETKAFTPDDVETYLELINSLQLSDGPKRQRVIAVLNFLSYYEEIDYENQYTIELLRLLNNLKAVSNSRPIPPGTHILRFSIILEDFFKTCNKDDKRYIRYFPIILWWKITTVIPLRPFEFCAIVPDCLAYEESKCYLKLPRLKMTNKEKKYRQKKQIVDKIRIPRDIELLILEYQSLVKQIDKSDRLTLISREIYEKTNNGGSHNLKRSKAAFLTPDLGTLINSFYGEIVEKVYQLTSTPLVKEKDKSFLTQELQKADLFRVRSIDTRHIAFINMLAQGWSKPEIARFGGHRVLETQAGYQNHREYWIEIETKKMMEKFNLGLQTNYSTSNERSGIKDNHSLSMRLDSAFKKKFVLKPPSTNTKEKLKLGICTDPIQRCKSHCLYCNYWRISSEEFELKREQLLDFINECDNNIHELLAFLKDLNRFVFHGELNPDIASKILSSQKQINDELYKRAMLFHNLENSNIKGGTNG